MHWEDSFRHLAAHQDGTIGIDQLAEIGTNGEHWRRAKQNGRWTPLSRRVLRSGCAPITPGTRTRAALLDAGGQAVLHGGSTLAWFGLRGFDLSQIHVTRRRGTTNGPCELAVVHHVRDLDTRDVVIVRGMPTMTALRAIWSEASRWTNPAFLERNTKRIGRLLDDAHTMRLLTWAQLHESVARLGRRGRAGTSVMREVARKRPPGSSVTESRNEDRFEEVLSDAGAGPMERQVVVGGVAPIGRADFSDPDLPLVAEVNSLAFHSTPSDQEADEVRYAQMVDAGFCVAVIWEGAVWSHRSSVVATIAEARRRARRGDASVVHTVGCPWPHDPARIVVGFVRPYRG